MQNNMKLLDSIPLTNDTAVLLVPMDYFSLVECRSTDNIFLFTYGLGPCIAALAICRLKTGKNLLGLNHMSHDNPRDSEEIDTLCNSMKTHNEFCGEKIELYLAGGMTQPSRHASLIKHCQQVEGIVLKGVLLDPYSIPLFGGPPLATDIMYVLNNISLTAGITANGEPMLAKSINVDVIKFSQELAQTKKDLQHDRKAFLSYCFTQLKVDFKNYCESRGIKYYANDSDDYPGFTSLTCSQLKESEKKFENINGSLSFPLNGGTKHQFFGLKKTNSFEKGQSINKSPLPNSLSPLINNTPTTTLCSTASPQANNANSSSTMQLPLE